MVVVFISLIISPPKLPHAFVERSLKFRRAVRDSKSLWL